jgi:hypothetical protein
MKRKLARRPCWSCKAPSPAPRPGPSSCSDRRCRTRPTEPPYLRIDAARSAEGKRKEGATHLVIRPPDVEQAFEKLALAVVGLVGLVGRRARARKALCGRRSRRDGCWVADLAGQMTTMTAMVVMVVVVLVADGGGSRRGRWDGRPGGRGHAAAEEGADGERRRETGERAGRAMLP